MLTLVAVTEYGATIVFCFTPITTIPQLGCYILTPKKTLQCLPFIYSLNKNGVGRRFLVQISNHLSPLKNPLFQITQSTYVTRVSGICSVIKKSPQYCGLRNLSVRFFRQPIHSFMHSRIKKYILH